MPLILLLLTIVAVTQSVGCYVNYKVQMEVKIIQETQLEWSTSHIISSNF